ncbi:hypothetical protein D9M69_543430 [compost metagenome]
MSRFAMESKTARLTVLIDPHKKKAFEELCAAQDLTPSQVVRQLIRDYLDQHGVTYATKSTLAATAKSCPLRTGPRGQV